MTREQRLLSEHRAHEEVQGYDPDIFQSPRGRLTIGHAFAIGTVAVLLLIWLAGLIGAVIDAR